ncbi:MarR family transcriptional regulator [Rhodococcus erythropolis]|uniref:MarR family transcriptional regulator n=1 Tax=Rhodococcus erythropolis TaxID=1833 RepID=UPI0037AE41EB
MTFTPTQEFDVLHGLRIKGMTKAEELATSTDIDIATIQVVLDAAIEQELARSRKGGRVEGYMLTAAGRERHATLRADNVPARFDELTAAYDAFLAPNRAFKTLTTKWQTEANGDSSVVQADLDALHHSVHIVLTRAASAVPRMKTYEPRFTAALNQFRSGETSALARPMSGSYHDVWMELHEDLLLMLGRERTDADE